MNEDTLTTVFIDGMNGFINADVATRQWVEENTNIELESLNQSAEKMKNKIEKTRSREQMWNLDHSSRQETRHASYSKGSSFGFNQVYQELTEHRLLLKQIQEAIKSKETHHNRQVMNALDESHRLDDDDIQLKDDNPTSEHGAVGVVACFRSETFFDCDSRSSEHEFYSLREEWSRPCTPSPAGYLESSPSFCPEQFTIDGSFQDPFFVLSETRSATCSWIHEYCVLYAETPRRWRRLTVSADFRRLKDQVPIREIDTSHEHEGHSIELPSVVADQVNRQLPFIDLFNSVTHLALHLGRNEKGLVCSDPARTTISENWVEAYFSGENQILCDIEDLGCKQFLESEIITQSRKSASCFIVRVEARTCIERKAPFVFSGIRGENGFQTYFNELKLLKSLRGCRGVTEFIGVVLDDTRTHLRSYLYEYPALASILAILAGAQSRSEIIPWDIRESWARQIVATVADIHSGRGSLVGSLHWLQEIGVRANGTIAFTLVRSSQKYFGHRPGGMAPELRALSSTDPSVLAKRVNFRTEVFQLGLLLWMLGEHKTNTNGCFCARFACTTYPRYMCTLDHANPVELPPCSAGVPLYFNDIIKQSRVSDPKKRKTAHQLQQMFPPIKDGDDEIISASGIEILKRCARFDSFCIHCDECGSRDMKIGYHCDRCSWGEFDLCRQCVSQGISCPDPRHQLTKRMQTNQRTFEVISE